MATAGVAYDHPNRTVRRTHSFVSTAGSGAISGHFMFFQKSRLIAVHTRVHTVGTSNSPGNALTLKLGTTSIGLLATGTVAALSTIAPVLLTNVSDSMDYFTVTQGTDLLARSYVVLEYETTHDSVFTIPS